VCEHSEIERVGVVEDLGVDGVDGDSLGSVVGIEAVGEGELGGVGMDGEEEEKEGEEREHGECQTSTNTQSILSLLRHPHSYKSHKCTTFTHKSIHCLRLSVQQPLVLPHWQPYPPHLS